MTAGTLLHTTRADAGGLHIPRARARNRRRRRQDPDQRRPRATIQLCSTVKSDGRSAYRALPTADCLHEPHAEPMPQAAGELMPWVHIRHPPPGPLRRVHSTDHTLPADRDLG